MAVFYFESKRRAEISERRIRRCVSDRFYSRLVEKYGMAPPSAI
jgi:hypothetical protein